MIEAWRVKREKMWVIITCPHCDEWFQLVNIPGEIEVYHYCPYCGKPLRVKEEDKYDVPSKD